LLTVKSPGELEAAFARMSRERASALIIVRSLIFLTHRARIAELAATARLPTICSQPEYVEAGCLMSYSASLRDLWRRSAYFVDKILKGAKPAALPVEQPTKFELLINRKTAKALGLTIPPSLLLRADQIIE
jgi:putative ABC transport system substrate-binding protein